MSDIEDYSIMSDNDDNSDSEMSFKQNKIVNKNLRAKPTIQDYDDVNDDENDDNDDDIDDENTKDNIEQDIEDNEIDVGDDDDDDDEDDDSDEELEDDGDEELEDHGDEEKNNLEQDFNKYGGSKTKDKSKNTNNKDKKQSNITLDVNNDYDDLDDDDEELNENYLQKFDKELTKNYIMNFHPECLNHNYDEIKSLSIVTRDQSNIVIDPLHKTLPFLTKYEQARILGQRSKQIECGAKPLVKVPENIIDSYIIAKLELEQKKIPFIIRRPIPNGSCEYWNLKDLEMIAF
jgi:DNA-directed RNA polymerase subunit K/omega